jgi:phosphatidylglycerophosphate synthase
MTISRYVTVPNALSASRVIFLPLLWVLALLRMETAFVICYALVGITDLFDGFAARRLNQRSAFGKTLDSFADLLYYLSSAFFMAWLYMDYLKPNLPLLYVFFGFLVLSFIVSAIKCGKPIMMHTLLLKLNAVLVYVGVILSAFIDTTIFVTVVLAVYLVSYTEEILIFLIHGEVDPDSPTIFNVRPKAKKG